jgi:hypothetical protein
VLILPCVMFQALAGLVVHCAGVLVADGGTVAAVVRLVGNNLEATVGKLNFVLA